MASNPNQPHVMARNRRIVGLALVASGGVLLLLAALFYAGIIPLRSEQRPVIALVMVAAGLADALIGVRFLSMASTK